jgi:hypothetical protein
MATLEVVDPHIHLWNVQTHHSPWMASAGGNFMGNCDAILKTYDRAEPLRHVRRPLERTRVMPRCGRRSTASSAARRRPSATRSSAATPSASTAFEEEDDEDEETLDSHRLAEPQPRRRLA